MKTWVIVIIGILIGISIVLLWPVVFGAVYVVGAVIAAIAIGIWTILQPILIVLFGGFVIYVVCKFFYDKGKKKGEKS